MRISDVCTRLKDASAIAALFQCLLRMLYRLRRSNQRWRSYAHMLINENRWRAQRYGVDEGMIDFGRGQITLAIEGLRKIHLRKPNAPNVLMFFTAKRDEIVNIYSNAPSNEKTRIFNVLSQIDPGNLSRYEKITKG